MAYTVRVDKLSCQSSGRCIETAPSGFAWDADHVAEARSEASQLPDETLRAIARRCPALAIQLFDAEGAEVDF